MELSPNDVLLMINDLARAIRTEADRRARIFGLTRAQWIILARLSRSPGLSQRELAEILEIEPITVGRMVDRLEAASLAERRPDPTDRRIWRLYLRPQGEAVLAPLGLQRDDIQEIATQGLQPEQLEALITTLHHMKDNMANHRRTAAQQAAEPGQR
jgi:DNA-binding MarR family transcriptional regulator